MEVRSWKCTSSCVGCTAILRHYHGHMATLPGIVRIPEAVQQSGLILGVFPNQGGCSSCNVVVDRKKVS